MNGRTTDADHQGDRGAAGLVLAAKCGLGNGARVANFLPNTRRQILQATGEALENPREVVGNITLAAGSLVNNSTHLPRLLLQWGAGQTQQTVTIDLRNGTTFCVAASSLTLVADMTVNRVVGGGAVVGPTFELNCSLSYGARPTTQIGDIILTSQEQSLLGNASLAAPIAIPRLATHVAFSTSAASAVVQPLRLTFQSDSVSASRNVVAPPRLEFVAIPNGMQQIDATDLTGAPQNDVKLLFAINL